MVAAVEALLPDADPRETASPNRADYLASAVLAIVILSVTLWAGGRPPVLASAIAGLFVAVTGMVGFVVSRRNRS